MTDQQLACLYKVCVDNIMPLVSPNAWKVMCAIIRQITDQWWAEISYRDFTRMTRISSPNALRSALQELLDWTYIRRRRVSKQKLAYAPNWHFMTYLARETPYDFKGGEALMVDEGELERELSEIEECIARLEDAEREFPFDHRAAFRLWDYSRATLRSKARRTHGQLSMWGYALDARAAEYGYSSDAHLVRALKEFAKLESQIAQLKAHEKALMQI